MDISANCIRAVATCLGGPYHIGNLRATCSSIRSATPAAPKKFTNDFLVCKYCCRNGDLATLERLSKTIKALPYNQILLWAVYYRQNDMARNLLSLFRKAQVFYLAIGGAASGDLEQFNWAYKICCDRCGMALGFQLGLYGYLLERNAGRSGEISMCEEVSKITMPPHLNEFLNGAAEKGHAELCETLIARGARDYEGMFYWGCIKDRVEVFDLGVKYMGLKHCIERTSTLRLKSKIRTRLKRLNQKIARF